TGPKSLAGTFPEPPKPGKGNLELFNQYASLKGIKEGDFEVLDALGTRLNGALDAKGFISVAGAAPGPASVLFGPDPADTWNLGSYFPPPQPKPAGVESIVAQAKAMMAKALPSGSSELLDKGKALASTGMGAVQSVKDGLQAVQQVRSNPLGALQGAAQGMPQLAGVPGLDTLKTASDAWQTAQQVHSTVQAASQGLPQLLTAVAPSAPQVLSAAKKAGDLPGVPTIFPSTAPLKTPVMNVSELLS
ncbi:type VI secretion system tip protein VgrG, partial [Pseudomonas sp. MAFF 301350]|nr:type VI secretion system tip protein VgrG [Pseudomonas aegrilactucae]